MKHISTILCIILTGCTFGNRVSYEATPRPATNPASIEVFDSSTLSRPYKIIGMVTADSNYMHSALKSIRAEAAALGANAVIDFGPNGNQTGIGMAAGSAISLASKNTGWQAKAIVWQ